MTDRRLAQVYMPSFMVDLCVRFDESIEIDVGGGRMERLVTEPGQENTSFFIGRSVIAGNVSLDGHRKAATFHFTIPFSDLPLDSKFVSAVGVHVHLGCVTQEDYKRGMAGQRRADGSLYSTIQTRDARNVPNPDTLLLSGSADKVNTTFGGKNSVSFEGRDNRGLLLDSPFDPRKLGDIPTSEPLDVVVRFILRQHRLLSPLMQVVTYPREWTGPLPAPATEVSRPQRGASGSRRPHASPPGDSHQTSFWDLIIQYSFLCGVIPHIIGDNVVLQRARNIYDESRLAGHDPRYPTPFARGLSREVDGEPINIRRLVLGHELEEVTFSKQLTGNRGKIVECVSLNTSAPTTGTAARVLRARWPQPGEPTRATATAPQGNDHQRDVMVIPVHGVHSLAQLTDIAHGIYEEVSRGEQGGGFKTKYLSSFGGNSADPDLVSLRPGNGIELTVDTARLSTRSPRVSSILAASRGSFDEQVARILESPAINGNVNLARALAAGARGSSSPPQRFFHITTVKYTYGSNACSIDAEFDNFVDAHAVHQDAEARRNAANATAPQDSAAATAANAAATAAAREDERFNQELREANADFDRARAAETAETRADNAREEAIRRVNNDSIDRTGIPIRDTVGGYRP